MSFMSDFKSFVMRGNIVDFAVGIIIGAAFGKIISSLVSDIIMPPIGMLVGGVDFSSLVYTLKPAVENHEAVVIKYGLFLNFIIDFLLIALVIFFLVKIINKYKKDPTPAPVTKDCPECLMPVPILAKRCGHCTEILIKN